MERCLLISGRVQGVGFRYWTLRRAAEIGGLSGYVCNLPDGNVLTLFSGSEEAMDKLTASLYKGPIFARVDSVKAVPEMVSYFPPLENGVFKRF